MMPNNFISADSQFLHLKPDESRKNIWKDLALNPSLPSPLATTSATRPCLIGLEEEETEDAQKYSPVANVTKRFLGEITKHLKKFYYGL